ncbi:MAG: hypothetical protein HOQ03_10190 [Thermoleophilia bacterium]|nr:hypothetical protein [Thermoleophilia bacterium]
MQHDVAVLEWLLGGDPAVRWQVLRDLLDEPPEVWEAERQRVAESGWGAAMLERRGTAGWPKGRWTDAPWSLLQLLACGLPEDHHDARADTDRALSRFMPDADVEPPVLFKRNDLCHLGFWLGLGSYFLAGDARLPRLAETVLWAQLDDGGWNCVVRRRPETVHSSFHTTFNVLENLRIAAARGVVAQQTFADAEARALDFVLAHRLYRSDHTGEVIDARFTQLTYPWHWHYTVLRGLDYLRLTLAIRDERAADAIELLRGRVRPNGRWPLQGRIPGTPLVEMEKPGQESRWNTLRARRILRAVDG